MSPSDLEQELRSLALVPREDNTHREALGAALRRRYRQRLQQRRVSLMMAVFLLLTAGLARQSNVVSYGYRFDHAIVRAERGQIDLTRFPEDRSSYTTGLSEPLTETDLARLQRKASLTTSMHDAGLDVPVSLFGIASGSRRQLYARYRTVADGETLTTGYAVQSDMIETFLAMVRSGHYPRALKAAAADLLPRLPDTLMEVDGVTFRVRRWLAHAPETGDFVLLKGDPLDEALLSDLSVLR